MSDPRRLIVASSIRTMEQGEFQEFCLAFLPVYHERFKGLERFGGTANGKTRKGTPDLIKTLEDGGQIGVECSVEADYWKRPRDRGSLDSWKPCQDIVRCCEHVDDLREIVLCSNREVPSNLPNLRSEVVSFARTKTEAKITIITAPLLEQELLNSADTYENVISRHLKDYAAYLSVAKESTRPSLAEISLDIYKKFSLSLDEVTGIAEKAVSVSLEEIDAGELALEMAAQLPSRFQRSPLPTPPSVQRICAKDYFGKGTFGQVCSVVGVPKIGKTSFLAQICAGLDRTKTRILWFDPPLLKDDQEDFCRELSRAVLTLFTNSKTANEFADKKLSLNALGRRLDDTKLDTDVQVVIDDAQNLGDKILCEIDGLIGAIRSSHVGANLRVIFVGHRSLKGHISQLENEYGSPPWNETELRELLVQNDIQVQGDLQLYARTLVDFSGGHPLVAIALARKAPSIEKLVLSRLDGTPALYDEDLTEEVKRLLFDQLLTHDDLRDFFIRVACLVYPAKLSALEFLSTRVEPSLRTPYLRMVEKLEGSLLEGDAVRGYQAAFVFRQVARPYASRDDQKRFFERMSEFLLAPQNKVIKAEEAIEGIMYATLSENPKRAFWWTSFLLYDIHKLKTEQLAYLLTRLVFIEALDTPTPIDVRIPYQVCLLQMATGYSNLGNTKRAAELLTKILDHPVVWAKAASGAPVPPELLYNSVRVYLVLQLALQQDFARALKILDELNPVYLPAEFARTELAKLVADMVARGKPSDFPKRLLCQLVKSAGVSEEKGIDHLTDSFLKLGVRVSQEASPTDIQKLLAVQGCKDLPLWGLFAQMTEAQMELQAMNSMAAIQVLDKIELAASTHGINSRSLTAKVHILRGDALYQMGKDSAALKSYRSAQEMLPTEEASFDRAWAIYRIGSCTENSEDAISAFSDASKYFDSLGYKHKKAVSDGERGVLLYKESRVDESVLAFEALMRGYYIDGCHDYAPAATMALALLGRLQLELAEKPIPSDDSGDLVYPPFERGIFGKVLEHAQPIPGVCTAFYTLGRVYGLLGLNERKIGALELAFAGIPKIEIDVSARVFAAFDIVFEFAMVGEFEKCSNVVNSLFRSTTGDEIPSHNTWVYLAFGKIDQLVTEGRLAKSQYDKLLDVYENAASCLSGNRKSWWLAEIYKRKAGIDGVTPVSELKPQYLSKSLAYSVKSENYSVLLEVSQRVAFASPPLAKSFKGLGKLQCYVILALCHDGGDIARLQTFGSNLLNMWPNVDYTRRLSEDDLPFWKPLHDGARDFDSKNIASDMRPALMVLFLLSASGLTGDPKYAKAVAWAKSVIGDRWHTIPTDLTQYLPL